MREKDRIAALARLTSRPALAKALLAAVKDGSFDKKQLSSLPGPPDAESERPGSEQLLDENWGKVTESSAQMKATIARLQKAYQEAPLWAFDAGAGKKVFTQDTAPSATPATEKAASSAPTSPAQAATASPTSWKTSSTPTLSSAPSISSRSSQNVTAPS